MTITNICARFFYIIFLCGLLGCEPALGDDLKIYYFKVGSGNLVLMVKDDEALFVDCGAEGKCANSKWLDQGNHKDLMRQCLKGVKNLAIVLTHNHSDHTNLCEPIKALMREIFTETIAVNFTIFTLQSQRGLNIALKPIDNMGPGRELIALHQRRSAEVVQQYELFLDQLNQVIAGSPQALEFEQLIEREFEILRFTTMHRQAVNQIMVANFRANREQQLIKEFRCNNELRFKQKSMQWCQEQLTLQEKTAALQALHQHLASLDQLFRREAHVAGRLITLMRVYVATMLHQQDPMQLTQEELLTQLYNQLIGRYEAMIIDDQYRAPYVPSITPKQIYNFLAYMTRKSQVTDIAVLESWLPVNTLAATIQWFRDNVHLDEVKFTPLRPEVYPDRGGDKQQHRENLMLLSQYGEHGDFFPGDSNEALIDLMLNSEEPNFNPQLLQIVTEMLASHHGTVSVGSARWIDVIAKLRISRHPLVCFVSANPAHKGYKIPAMDFVRSVKASTQLIPVAEHKFSIHYEGEERFVRTRLPIYNTHDAQHEVLMAVIPKEGDMRLYDGLGAEQEPTEVFIESWIRPEDDGETARLSWVTE